MPILKPLDAHQLEYLVFGLTWDVVVGSRPEKEALSRVRAARASHYVMPGPHASVVGFGRLDVPETGAAATQRAGASKPASKGFVPAIASAMGMKPTKGPALYSAAQLFADRHPHGVNAYLVEIDEDQVWFVATHDGEVIPGCDEVFPGQDEARLALTELRKDHPQAVVVTEVRFEPVTPSAQLRRRQNALLALPLSVRLSLGMVLVALAINQGEGLWSALRDATGNARPVAVTVDANAAWRDQLDRWQQGIALDGPAGFQALLSGIGQVPMKVANWPLVSLHCAPSAVGWQCRAIYKRGAQASSTNSAFSAALPPGWQVRWLDLEQGKTERAQVEWQLRAIRQPLDRAQLPNTDEVERDYVSRVQAVSAAFKVVVVPKVLPAPSVPVPTYQDGEGQTVAVSAQDVTQPQAKVPGLRGLQFEGPLRSMTVLPLPKASVIQRFDLTVAESREPSLANSLLTAAVSGVFYVQ